MKKILGIATILCVSIIILCSLTASAYETGTCGDNVTWGLSNGTLRIEGTGPMDDYQFSGAPWNSTGIERIYISYGITYIGTYAFYRHDALEEISIPNSVTAIGSYAFYDCETLTTVDLPDSLTEINNHTFEGCTALTKVLLPDSLTFIGDSAFNSCFSLSDIDLPYGVVSIGNSAFASCYALSSIDIPNSVTTLGSSAFSYCRRLSSITLPDSIITIPDYTFINCAALNIQLTNNVNYIGTGAFWGCNTLTDFTIPDNVTYIGESAFYSCYGLKSINIPENITDIKQSTFANCSNLQSIIIPHSITYIGDSAFDNCVKLSDIYIPIGVTHIGSAAFRSCKELTSVALPEGITIINDNTFSFCEKLTDIYIPDSITSIGNSAFKNCDNLSAITLPEGLTSIGDSAFNACSLLSEIALPQSLDYIGEYAFSHTVNLKKIVLSTEAIPAFMENISTAFNICYASDIYCTGSKAACEEKGLTDLTEYFAAANIHYLVTYTIDYGDRVERITSYDGILAPESQLKEEADFKGWYDEVGNEIVFPYIQENDTAVYGEWTCNLTYIGDYENTIVVSWGAWCDLQQPPFGYTYSYFIDGVEWLAQRYPIQKHTTIEIKATSIMVTVTYMGALDKTDSVISGSSVILPTPPYGYTYTFEADGEEWTGESITADVTVDVTMTPITYTITYTGDYENTVYADYLTNIELPVAQEGYVYKFTCNGEEWSGKEITDNATVAVEELCDMAEISFNNLENMTVSGNNIYGEYYNNPYIPSYTLSEKATCQAYYDISCTSECTTMPLSRGENTLYFMVTAESGRYEVYKVTINHNLPESLGALITTQQIGASFIAKFENEIPGNPKIEVYAGYDKTNLYINTTSTKYDPERKLLTIAGGLEEDTYYWLKAYAYYGDTILESIMLYDKTGTTLSSECLLVSLNGLLAGGIIDHEKETVSGIRVANSISQIPVDAKVSNGASWKLYKRPNASIAEENEIIDLTEYAGFEKTMYIKVTSEDGNHTKTYALTVYRQSKTTELPHIAVLNRLATISVENGCTIYYTTDGSDPTLINGEIYTAPFEVQEKTIIKAIAKAADKDEVGDVITLVVQESASVLIEGASFKRAANEYFFDLYLISQAPIKGQLIIALYNDKTLNTLNIIPVDSEDIEKSILHTIYTAAPAEYCRIFMWNTEKGALENISNVYTYDY